MYRHEWEGLVLIEWAGSDARLCCLGRRRKARALEHPVGGWAAHRQFLARHVCEFTLCGHGRLLDGPAAGGALPQLGKIGARAGQATSEMMDVAIACSCEFILLRQTTLCYWESEGVDAAFCGLLKLRLERGKQEVLGASS